MTSKQSDENTETYSAAQLESLNIDERLEALDCPFTWGLYGVSMIKDDDLRAKKGEYSSQMIVDRRDYFPELELINHLIRAYEDSVDNELLRAMERINKAEERLADIKEKEVLKNVEKVLHHLVMGSKCHLLKELGRLTEVDELLKEICDTADMNKTELAMLIGSQCLAFSLFMTDNSRGILYARLAIIDDPSNGKWHFLLGQNYRESRRTQFSPFQLADEKETSAFEEAYRLSPNALFGASLAQVYRESGKCDMANKIYKEVHDLQPTSCAIRFQLALGFIRAQEPARAKECLDYIAERMPDCTRWTHYMGIYEEKCNKNFKAALPYYKKTTEDLNWTAEWQYVECRKKVEPDWDPLPYLLDLLKKYEPMPDFVTQDVNIQIGSYYLFELHDVLSACQYLTEAIEIKPSTKQLRKHTLLFRDYKRVNLYHVLAKEVQFALEIGASVYDEEKISVLKNALELCRKNCLDLPVSSPQRSNSYRNEGRGSSSHEKTNWRAEKPGSSSRGFSGNQYPRWNRDRTHSSNRFAGTSQQRDYTSWRSDKRPIQNNTSKDKEVSASTDCLRNRGVRQTGISRPQDKNDGGEASASCNLLKTVKDLNI